MIYLPVCGTDGNTYPSPCALDVADCLSDEEIKKDHDGKCSKLSAAQICKKTAPIIFTFCKSVRMSCYKFNK